jgi:hypothetical protein
MATQDIMTKTTGNSPIPRNASQAERRGSRRCKINQLMRIRPSDPEKEHFEDLRGSTSREYLAEVVRLDALPNGLNGIGIKLLMEMGMQHSYSFSPPQQRK